MPNETLTPEQLAAAQTDRELLDSCRYTAAKLSTAHYPMSAALMLELIKRFEGKIT